MGLYVGKLLSDGLVCIKYQYSFHEEYLDSGRSRATTLPRNACPNGLSRSAALIEGALVSPGHSG
jgi:hypothetical protein